MAEDQGGRGSDHICCRCWDGKISHFKVLMEIVTVEKEKKNLYISVYFKLPCNNMLTYRYLVLKT